MGTCLNMPIQEIIERVTAIAKNCKAEHLSLFGSFANGTAGPTSDVDFIVWGCPDMEELRERVDEIETLRKIDLFNYDEVCSSYLREDMDRYGRKIY